jgi:hypothetical protein
MRNVREVVLARKKYVKSEFDQARDELFSHIHRCGVLQAAAEDQIEWMDETLEFMEERYPELTKAELAQLRDLGLRFCQPVKPHGTQDTPTSEEDANAA